jgi:hypothetical protein
MTTAKFVKTAVCLVIGTMLAVETFVQRPDGLPLLTPSHDNDAELSVAQVEAANFTYLAALTGAVLAAFLVFVALDQHPGKWRRKLARSLRSAPGW